MGPQVGLSLRRVFHHKVHDGVSLQENMCSGVVSAGGRGRVNPSYYSLSSGLTFV